MATVVSSHHPPEPMLHDRLLTAGEVNPAAVFAPEMTAPAPVTPPAEPARSADPAAPTDAAAETVPAPDPAPDEDGVLRLLKGKLVSRKAQRDCRDCRDCVLGNGASGETMGNAAPRHARIASCPLLSRVICPSLSSPHPHPSSPSRKRLIRFPPSFPRQSPL